MKRLFIAVKIEPQRDLLIAFEEFKNKLSRERIKWVNPDNLHITLKFLGDTDEKSIEAIKDTLSEIAAKHPKTIMTIRGSGVFPNQHRPRVLWFGIERNEKLKDLAGDIDDAMAELGFEPETRAFKPHLTIGRVKFVDQLGRLKKLLDKYRNVHFQDTGVNEIVLFESKLHPQGPQYSVVEKFELNG